MSGAIGEAYLVMSAESVAPSHDGLDGFDWDHDWEQWSRDEDDGSVMIRSHAVMVSTGCAEWLWEPDCIFGTYEAAMAYIASWPDRQLQLVRCDVSRTCTLLAEPRP